ncbi:MAG: GTP pyrophosphokinase [Deltaproteobacteria bacterium CG2_30_63_29]|nr:MAG: GTP pyrophosphokinase [Deltaproteobacteria bacterium CG2_30_63_29]PJB39737.1 MAG: GTP pyrophosphokinase [Deltaproteobacteria bacterium CG_4_9_14_3_um_filter_63_12]
MSRHDTLPETAPACVTLEDAIAIAVEAHRGQKDKAGACYILHPLRVMMTVEGDLERMTAILHDVVEDSELTLVDLARKGVPPAVLEALVLLTKQEAEPYADFIERLAPNGLARAVKIADLEDNMDTRRLDALDDRALERLQRYHAAWRRLHEAQ